MLRKKIILATIFVALAFVIGFGAGYKTGRGNEGYGKNNNPEDNTSPADTRIAKELSADQGLYPDMSNEAEIKNIVGEVKEVDGHKIILKTRAMALSVDSGQDIRTIIFDNSTKIYQMEQKDPATVQKEMEEFEKMLQGRINDPANVKHGTPPEIFTKKEIKISDLKVGQSISIKSETDIRAAEEIKASEITVNQMIILPPANLSNVSVPAGAVDALLSSPPLMPIDSTNQ